MIQFSPDPVELELMRNLFEAAAEEMGIVLQRVAFSANIKERRDFSCAIFDCDGSLLAQAAHIPVHLGSMPASVAAVLARLGSLDESDVAIVNDPFAGGTHLPDITLVSPIFYDAMLVGYSANRAHHADVGGISPGSMTLSRHVDEEGIRVEPSLLYRRGVRDDSLLHHILAAVRTRDERLGDLDAQLASNHVGADMLRRMVAQYGIEYVQRYGAALLEYSQSFMSRAIEGIPDGKYAFEDAMDDDGAGNGPVAIRATVRIAGESAIVDLSASADQVPGCINCPEAVTRSAAYYCFGCLLDESIPLNGGCFRNIDVITRPGSVLHATYPAAVVAGNTETSQRVVDVVFGALAQALPHRIPAASCGTMNNIALGSPGRARLLPSRIQAEDAARLEPRPPESWTYYETIGGGCGAGPTWHGESAIQCHMTNTLNTPAEAIEMQYPLRIRRFERAHNAGGAGKFRGGDGIIREIEALEDCHGTILADRRVSRPYGIAGGKPAAGGCNVLVHADSRETQLPGKCSFSLQRGEKLRIITPGGGGWG